MSEASTMSFTTYHPHYKEKRKMTKFAHKPFFLQPLPNLTDFAHNLSFFRSSQKLLSSTSALSDSIVKFGPQHSYYKKKLNSNQIQIFVCIAGYLYFRYNLDNLGNLSIAFFFTYNSGIYAVEPNIITKNEKLPRTALNLFHFLQSLSLLFSLKIFKCALISVWQLSLTLARFPMLTDYPSVKLTSKTFLDLSHIV